MAKKSKGVTGSAPMPAAMSDWMPEPTPRYQPFPKCQDQGPSMKNLDFARLIAKGESSKGFVSQTANGTARDMGRGWNRDEPYSSSWEAPEGGPWQSGPSNRTAE